MSITRSNVLFSSIGAAVSGLFARVAGAQHEHHHPAPVAPPPKRAPAPNAAAKPVPRTARTSVVTPNVRRRCRYKMVDGVKEFHLTAEPVRREFIGRIQRQLLGLQRLDARADHRGLRRRSRAHPGHEQTARGDVRALARLHPAQRHGRRERPQSAEDRAGRDVRVRVHAQADRHADVPPAFRRDGADRDGHARLLRHPSARRRACAASTATSPSSSTNGSSSRARPRPIRR